MNAPLKVSTEEIVYRLEILEASRETLKSEFIGIDLVIDQLIDSVRTWYSIPNLQEKPMVVSLFGMTGTGKSSLIQRLSELLKMDNAFYNIDMGNSQGSYSFFESLNDLFDNNNGRQFMLMIDEFQHARSIDSDGEEIRYGEMGMIWKILDSGRVELHDFKSAIIGIEARIKVLKLCVRRGVEVKKGYVTKNLKTFCRITNEDFDSIGSIRGRDSKTGAPKKIKTGKKSLPFFPSYELDDVMDLQPGVFSAESEVAELLETMNADEIIAFLERILEEGKMPKVLDCTKSLIVVAGNLDEAYNMSGDMNPDVPADVYQSLVKDISLNHIKEALRKRFRSEQIARLGNNIIIYPAMGEAEFKAFIRQTVNRLCSEFERKYGIELSTKRSLLNIIYKEGVFPTQGFRPVSTTIDRFVRCKLSSIVGTAIIEFPETTTIELAFRAKKLRVGFWKSNLKLGEKVLSVQLNLQDKRKLTFNDDQALTSVHEAGHVVCAALLLDDVPEIAMSVTSAADAGGFVIRTGKETLIQKNRLLKLTAFGLGGYVAEKVIFGNENLTAGSSSDLIKATARIKRILTQSGFEHGPACFDKPDALHNNAVIDHKGEIDKLTLEYLRSAEQMAKTLLETQKPLLLKMSEALFQRGTLKKKDMAEIVRQHVQLGEFQIEPKFPFKEKLTGQLEQLKGLQRVA